MDRPKADDVHRMFEAAVPILRIAKSTDKGRKRRLDQLCWSTIVRDKCHKGGDVQATEELVRLADGN